MVKGLLRFALLGGAALCLAASLIAKEPGEYRLDDTLAEDIVTPVALTVVNPDATEALKLKESVRVPIIVRFDPTAVDKVERELREVFAYNRSNFLNTVEASFGQRRLSEASVALPEFQSVVDAFNRKYQTLPLNSELAAVWARGDSGLVELAALFARVREVMERPIRPVAWPDNLKLSHTVRMVTMTNSAEALTLEISDERGVHRPRADLIALSDVRASFEELFPDEEQALARFVAIWLRPNCYADVEATRQDRARRTESLKITDNYEAGQMIASAGQVVDGKLLAALQELHERTAASRLQHQIAREQAQGAHIRQRSQWLAAGLALVTLGSITAFVWLARRRRPVTLLPAKIAGNVVGDDSLVTDPDDESWQHRTSIRAGMLKHLGQLLREKLVRGLVSQRGQLLDAQNSAAAEMAELERRLNELQAPLQERLRAYENRIADLEKALTVKGEENRELIKAKIQLTRRQLEAERTRNRLVLN